MKRTLVKYPPQAPELCEYNVISAARWEQQNNAERREKMRPFAGPYFDTEGWMLNAVLADMKNANIALVWTKARDERNNWREGIVVYRARAELSEDFDA